MATCIGQQMGMGSLAHDSLVFKRKYRWTFQLDGPSCNGSGLIPAQFVKLASRPNLTIEETEINYLHGKMWIPGKGTWETITVTYYDVGGAGSGASAPPVAGMANLYKWLASIYNFMDPDCLSQASTSRGYSGTGVLKLFDGCGKTMEQWTLSNAWPQAMNFGELDYSSSEEVTIELTLRYSKVKLDLFCGTTTPAPCCTGC